MVTSRPATGPANEPVRVPHPLAVGEGYQLDVDGFANGIWEGWTKPREDLNDGCYIDEDQRDNPYFQRYNVTAAHLGGCPDAYWYTRRKQTAPDEADPNGPQWVEYRPPLTILGKGRYQIQAEYRNTRSRAPYPALYEVTQGDGTQVTIGKCQRDGVDGACMSFDLGTFDLGSTGFVRVIDTGAESITFNRMIFTYLGPVH